MAGGATRALPGWRLAAENAPLDQHARVDRITVRRILDSHARPTLEFEVFLDDGRTGRGSAPRGETPSMYEDQIESGMAIAADAAAALMVEEAWTQERLDAALAPHESAWGRRATLAISIAFRNALASGAPPLHG